jgi:hypothetical protein
MLINSRVFQQNEPSKWFYSRYSFYIIWLIIFLCWLPYFIVLFPGIFSPDSISQFAQGLSIYEFSAQHTILHTAIMSAFIRLGDMLGSHNAGAALYSITQMVMLSLIFSSVIRYLAYRKVCTPGIAIIFGYFALYPVNAIYSVTGWKDVLFGGICLLLFIVLLEIFRRSEEMLFSGKRLTIICIIAVLFVLFRNNAVYAMLLFLPFFLISMRKYWKRTIPLVIICIAIISVFNWCAYNVFSVARANVGDALAVPLQQMARTVRDHNDKLTNAELEKLSVYFHVELLSDIYEPRLADSVKGGGLKYAAFQADPAGFVEIWIKLGLKYPLTYIASFLSNSYGYWYPDTNYGVYSMGNVYPHPDPMQLSSANLLPVRQMKFVELFVFAMVRGMPVFALVSSIGFMAWLITISVGMIVSRQKKGLLIPILLPGFVWFTTLAAPVYAEYRYVYGVMLCAPVIFLMSCIKDDANTT